MNKRVVAAAIVACAGPFSLPLPAWGHGAPEYPISRQYNCYRNPGLPACQAAIASGGAQAIYDWNGVNQGAAGGNHRAVVPDGRLCAGGQTLFKGFDLARSDWVTTPWAPGANGLHEFRYNATAPHRTLNWQFYLTRDGWDPGVAPLRWSDLDLVADVPAGQVVTTTNSRYVMQLRLPPRSGRHVLYAVWQRSDSTEAFYSCSDVRFGGANGTPPPMPTTYRQVGQVQARQDLPVGASVRLRLFDRSGTDLETHALTVSGAPSPGTKWLSDLAVLVNRSSRVARVGELEGGVVAVPAGRTILQVYATSADAALMFALDTRLPDTATPPPSPPPPTGGAADGTTWAEGRTYQVGQMVKWAGREWICIQTHTAWKGTNWQPDAPGIRNVLWWLKG